MQQRFFLFVTATVGLLVALTLALAAFPGVADAAPGCPSGDPDCGAEPIPYPPTVTADSSEITVMAGDEAKNTGEYWVDAERLP